MALTKEKKGVIVNDFRVHEKDTGSPEVQVALLSERIKGLTDHLKQFSKDHHSRHGLLKLVAQRRKQLDYLKKKAHPNTEKITRMSLVQALGLEKENPEELIDVAKKLLERFGHEIPPDQINVIAPHIDSAVQQYLQANPDINPQKWKAEHFPRLYR